MCSKAKQNCCSVDQREQQNQNNNQNNNKKVKNIEPKNIEPKNIEPKNIKNKIEKKCTKNLCLVIGLISLRLEINTQKNDTGAYLFSFNLRL